MPDIYVAFRADLTDEGRQSLDRLGWKLYENALGGSDAAWSDEDAPAVTHRRHVVRVPEKDTGDVQKLITDALGGEPADTLVYYDLQGAAERLGVHRETVKRRVARGELLADRRGSGPTAGLLLHKRGIDHRAEVEAHKRRVREAGIVVGYERDDDAFDHEMEQVHGRDTMEQVRAVRERHELLQEAARAVAADPDLRRQFEQLDDDEIIERTAHEIANRVRREERIRRRAAQILADDDEHHDA